MTIDFVVGATARRQSVETVNAQRRARALRRRLLLLDDADEGAGARAGCGGAQVPANVREVSEGLQYRDFITVGVLANKLDVKEPDGGVC